MVAAEHLAGIAPIDDVRASAVYRKNAALTAVRDLLAAYAVEPRRIAA
jgi:N-methylhydantoinase B